MTEPNEQPSAQQTWIELAFVSSRLYDVAPSEVTTPEAALELSETIQCVLGDLQVLLEHAASRLRERRFDAQPGLLGPISGIEAVTAAAVRLEVAASQARQAGASISQARNQMAYLTWPAPEASSPEVPSIRELMSGRAAALDLGDEPPGDPAPRSSGPELA